MLERIIAAILGALLSLLGKETQELIRDQKIDQGGEQARATGDTSDLERALDER